ncbi:MAG: bifunctional folylpolyglutamate synthase/dihydrofolate synthase [Lachnospiraceae bacterium]|nr:bifunctional folylpolyglutamate synthase/dihydrofolate synthase [Lachnospiraceae bacterium]
MNYSEAMDYLNSVATKGSIYGLETMRLLLREFGNPQDGLKCIHVAGTNGKGSVIAFIDSVLRRAGYKTGRYISPAVLDYCEKIQINGEYISEEDVAELITEIKEVAEKIKEATVFEIETIMAFLYFARSDCDYVILETGLGGAEDATNVIKNPLASVIASISMDHMNILGDTLEEIASCKAGIIKENCPAVIMKQKPSVQKVFEDRCRQMNSKLTVADYDMATVKSEDIKYRRFDYKEFEDIVISLTGRYQINNAVLALEVIKELRTIGIDISDEAVCEGMVKADWPARFSCLDDGEVKFFADGAHNEDAARSLRETMLQYFDGKKFVFIMGVLADKEYEKVIALTADMAEFIITITPPSPRALDAEQLKMAVSKVNRNVTAALTLKEAVLGAYEYAKSGDDAEDYVIVAFGSLSYMGDLYRVMDVRKAERS